MMCLASSVSSPPLTSLTASLPLPASLASPSNTVTLFFLSRKPTPRLSCWATPRLRLTTAAASKRGLSAARPKLVGVAHQLEDLGGAQQRLGRDAAPVEADAAQMLALDQRHLHAELCGPDGGDIAAGTAADDDQVEALGQSLASPLRRRPLSPHGYTAVKRRGSWAPISPSGGLSRTRPHCRKSAATAWCARTRCPATAPRLCSALSSSISALQCSMKLPCRLRPPPYSSQ